MLPQPQNAAVALYTIVLFLQRRSTVRLLFVITSAALVFLAVDVWQLRFRNLDKPLPYVKSTRDWATRVEKHPAPAADKVALPRGQAKPLRRIQHDFSRGERDAAHEKLTAERRKAVKDAMVKAWTGYRQYAWGADELAPSSLGPKQTFGGLGVTLVDSLDTLWIMGMKQEFMEAAMRASTIDWDSTPQKSLSLFETNIRFLGGMLSAYELSGYTALLRKALELGHMLYAAFDTPGRFPVNDFNVWSAWNGELQPKHMEISAAVGTLSMEFAKLAMLTGEHKFYSAIDVMKRALNETQDKTRLPGMWPTALDLSGGNMTTPHTSFSLGPNSDSMYEYLSKTYMLLGGLDETYATMHIKAMDTAAKEVLFRPMVPDKADILFGGSVTARTGVPHDQLATLSHLSCFTGGMYLISGRVFDRPNHGELGEKLALGCAWAYAAYPLGIMPEDSQLISCNNTAGCEWDEKKWMEMGGKKGEGATPEGFTGTPGLHYLLRPEALESLFIMYRVTGKKELRDVVWRMFQAIKGASETPGAFSSVEDVTVKGNPAVTDSMESYWTGETLKYLYLMFSEPDLISLDEWVFNTEAHPFKLPKVGSTLLENQVKGL